MSDLRRLNHWDHNLIKHVEDTVVCLTHKVFISASFFGLPYKKKCAIHFPWEKSNGNKPFKEKNRWYLRGWDKIFKGTVVNRALPTLLGGSLEITLTVSLSQDRLNRWCELMNRFPGLPVSTDDLVDIQVIEEKILDHTWRQVQPSHRGIYFIKKFPTPPEKFCQRCLKAFYFLYN